MPPQCPLKGERCPPDQLSVVAHRQPQSPARQPHPSKDRLSVQQPGMAVPFRGSSLPSQSLPGRWQVLHHLWLFPLSPGIKVWAHLCHYLHPGGGSHKHPWLSTAERAFVSVTSASPGRPGGQKRSIPEPPGMLSVLGRPSETFLPAGGASRPPTPTPFPGLRANSLIHVVLPSSFL